MKTARRTLSILLTLLMLVTSLPLAGFVGLQMLPVAHARSYQTGDIIEFGEYPQTQVTSNAVITVLNSVPKSWKSFNYYYGSVTEMNYSASRTYDGNMQPGNFMSYADIESNGVRYRAVKIDNYRPCDTMYAPQAQVSYQDNNYSLGIYYFKFSPIRWKVLDPSEGFVVSEKLLDSQPFQNIIYRIGSNPFTIGRYSSILATNYYYSTIRTWLNEDFYNTAFSTTEKAVIATTALDNNSALSNEKVFLLSSDEAENNAYGFCPGNQTNNRHVRKAYGTDYAKANGLLCTTTDGDSMWWLRSSRTTGDYYVPQVGWNGEDHYDVASLTDVGVRPAFCFKQGITITKDSLNLKVKSTYQLSLNQAFEQKVNWSSSNTSVATVSSTGKVTAKSAGSATITAKTVDGRYSATCAVTVTGTPKPVASFNIKRDADSVIASDAYEIYYNLTPWDATNRTITWTSSNTSVATVSNGIVTAKTPGVATITGRTVDGGFSDSIRITVVDDTRTDEPIITTHESVVMEFHSDWFFNGSNSYNQKISRLCSSLTVLGYKPEHQLSAALRKLGFSNLEINLKTGRDEVNYFIASRKIKANGKTKWLIFTGFIGSHDMQWNSNFDPLATQSTSSNGHASYNWGDVHLGFDDARYFVSKKLKAYVQDLQKNVSVDDTVLLITGHSRGAATANLVAADLIRGATGENLYTKLANLDNIFTYTFATPNCVKNTVSNFNDSKFERIFNIVNPEDFVTKVLPSKWGFSRYGTTYILPSVTNTGIKTYKDIYYPGVSGVYWEVTGGKEFTYYKQGEQPVFLVVNRFTSYVNNLDEYYEKGIPATIGGVPHYKAFFYFQNVLCPFVNGSKDNNKAAYNGAIAYALELNAGDPLQLLLFSRMTDYFIANQAITDKFADAHMAETYYAFMQTMTERQVVDGTPERRQSLYYSACCPVDIEVYEKDTGELVAHIINNEVDEEIAAKENALFAIVEGESKNVWIPNSDDYEIVLIGNDDGNLDYTVSTIDSDLGEVERKNYFDVPVIDGMIMQENTLSDGESDETESIIANEHGITLCAAQDVPAEEFDSITVETTVTGQGYVTGDGNYTSGDYVTLTAVTDENNSFLGWYDGEDLISESEIYGFVVKTNTSLNARFTDNIVESTGVTVSENQITLDLSDNENSVAIIDAQVSPSNATDKLCSFVSSNEDVASVDDFGMVVPKTRGNAIITVSCADGNYTATVDVTVICSHKESLEQLTGYSETCTEAGLTDGSVCIVCGDTVTAQTPINPSGHRYGAWTVKTPATCTQDGVEQRVCENDASHVETRPISATGHKWSGWTVVDEPTCTEDGLERRICRNDNSHIETRKISKTGHSDNDNDGFCDDCDADLRPAESQSNCACGKYHSGPFAGLIKFFHTIIYFFKNLFK